MTSGIKVYTVQPQGRFWQAVLNQRVVYFSVAKAQVVSVIRHAASENAPSLVVVRREDGAVEHELRFEGTPTFPGPAFAG